MSEVENEGREEYNLEQSCTEEGWSAAQAGPCLAGVFQPIKCNKQLAISTKRLLANGQVRRGGPGLQMATAVPPNTNIKL